MTILPPRIFFSCIAGVSNEQCRNRYVLYESYDAIPSDGDMFMHYDVVVDMT